MLFGAAKLNKRWMGKVLKAARPGSGTTPNAECC